MTGLRVPSHTPARTTEQSGSLAFSDLSAPCLSGPVPKGTLWRQGNWIILRLDFEGTSERQLTNANLNCWRSYY